MMPLDKFFLFLLFAADAPTHSTGKDTKSDAMVSNPVKETDEPCKNLNHTHFVIQGKKKKIGLILGGGLCQSIVFQPIHTLSMGLW